MCVCEGEGGGSPSGRQEVSGWGEEGEFPSPAGRHSVPLGIRVCVEEEEWRIVCGEEEEEEAVCSQLMLIWCGTSRGLLNQLRASGAEKISHELFQNEHSRNLYK